MEKGLHQLQGTEKEAKGGWEGSYFYLHGYKTNQISHKSHLSIQFRKVNERRAAIELEHALQGLDTDSDPDRPIYKTDTTTEWHWPWRTSEWYNSGGSGNALQRQPSFPHSLIRKLSSRFQGDDTELSRVRSRAGTMKKLSLKWFETELISLSFYPKYNDFICIRRSTTPCKRAWACIFQDAQRRVRQSVSILWW